MSSENRLKIFQQLKTHPVYGVINSDGSETYLVGPNDTISKFENFNFKDEASVDRIFDVLTSRRTVTSDNKIVFYWVKTKKEFYQYLCCDLSWAKTTSYCKDATSSTDRTDRDRGSDRTTSPSGGGERRRSSCVDISWVKDDVLTGGKKVKKCMKGTLVGIIQERLKHHGFPNFSKNGNVDSTYGSRTESEVIKFQKKFDLNDDGIVGEKTLEALLKDKTELKPVSTTTTPVDDFESDLTDVSTGTSGN